MPPVDEREAVAKQLMDKAAKMARKSTAVAQVFGRTRAWVRVRVRARVSG